MLLSDHSRFYSSSKLLVFDQPVSGPVGDPFVWHRTVSEEAVMFSAYQAWLPSDKVREAVESATHEAYSHRGELLLSEPLQFRADNVQLDLTPKEGMTWRAWSTALWGMRMALQDYDIYFEWNFRVLSRRLGETGYGTLADKTRHSVETSKRYEGGRYGMICPNLVF